MGACDAAARCVAGVARTFTYCRFTWQAWHQLTSTVGLRGRRGTDGIGWRAWTGLGACDAAALCVAGVVLPACFFDLMAGELSRSDGEDSLEEQTAVLLQLPCKLEDVCAQLCEKLQKVPLPALGHVAAPVGSLSPVLCSTPPADALDDHVRCTVMALSGNVVAKVFVLKGQPWLDAIPFGYWCHCWNVANFHLSDKDMVVFPRPRLSQLVPSDGSDIVLKVVTSNQPPPVNIRVVIGRELPPLRLTDRSLAPVRSTTSASFRLSCCEIWIGCN